MRRQLFAALLPLVLFWAIEEFWGLKAALVAGCVAAVLEVSWEKLTQGKVVFTTLVSNALVLGLGAISYVMDSGVAFKLQPAAMELGTAAFMAVVRFRGEPFLLRSFRDMKGMDAGKRDTLLSQPVFLKRMRMMDAKLTIFLVLHGAAVAWAAVWGTTRTWILLKGVLFYVLMFVVMAPLDLLRYKRARAK